MLKHLLEHFPVEAIDSLHREDVGHVIDIDLTAAYFLSDFLDFQELSQDKKHNF